MSPSSSVPPGQQKKLKDFLKAKGHAAGKVNALKVDTDTDLAAAVLSIHGVTESEYRSAGGGM